jgi:hypothetical protein
VVSVRAIRFALVVKVAVSFASALIVIATLDALLAPLAFNESVAVKIVEPLGMVTFRKRNPLSRASDDEGKLFAVSVKLQ